MRRRRLVVGLAGAIGTALGAGCAGLAPGAGPGEDETVDAAAVTPAPVPAAASTTTATPGQSDCPELPTNAEVYVCSPAARGGNALRLRPEATTYTVGADAFEFVLHNDTAFGFSTGRDWWTLARRRGDEWTTVEQGTGTDRMVVDPQGRCTWTVGTGGDVTPPPAAGVGDRHALIVTGYVSAGELTAVIAPFGVVTAAGTGGPADDGIGASQIE